MDSSPYILEKESIGKLLWKYSVPAVITTLAGSLYNIIDRIFIGQGVGAMAISGLALTFPIMMLIQAFGTLVGVGASTRISIVLGMKDKKWAERILGNALIITIAIWLLISVSCLLFLDPLLSAFGGSEQTIPFAKSYLYYVIPCSIFSNLSFSFCNIIRASGAPRKSMEIMLIGVIANIILDPIFIFTFKLGIQGAAIATALSMFISAFLTMQYFRKKTSYLHFQKYAFRLDKKIIWNIISIGMSPFLMNAAACVVNIILNNRLYENGGDLSIGAYGIINSYGILFVMVTIGLCQGMQPIVGFNYGAGKIDRVKSTLKKVIFTSAGVTSLGFILAECFPSLLASAFTHDPRLIEITSEGIRWVFLTYPLIGPSVVISNFFQSIGKVKISIFLSLSRQVLFLIPSLYLCSNLWGLTGVWVANPISDSIAIAIGFIILYVQIKKWNTKHFSIPELQ